MNNKKQTAMQMAIAHYQNLSEQGSNEAYVIAKFLKENFLLVEKQQHEETWYDSTLQFDNAAKMTNKKLFEDYYNETYGGNKYE